MSRAVQPSTQHRAVTHFSSVRTQHQLQLSLRVGAAAISKQAQLSAVWPGRCGATAASICICWTQARRLSRYADGWVQPSVRKWVAQRMKRMCSSASCRESHFVGFTETGEYSAEATRERLGVTRAPKRQSRRKDDGGLAAFWTQAAAWPSVSV